jgi:hypothetical protein
MKSAFDIYIYILPQNYVAKYHFFVLCKVFCGNYIDFFVANLHMKFFYSFYFQNISHIFIDFIFAYSIFKFKAIEINIAISSLVIIELF